jgi:hypothetical protein
MVSRICIVVAITFGLTGCQGSLESRAEELATCLDERGVRTTGHGASSGTIIVNGESREVEEGRVEVRPRRGQSGPRYRIAIYESAEDAHAFAEFVTRAPSSPEVLVVGNEALMIGSGLATDHAIVEGCLEDG